jgi:formamidopyrimidine-DNA glycosylase
MPELPEVEIVRRGLEPAVKGQVITHVDVWRANLRKPIPENFKALLEHKKITGTGRRGKYILVYLENGDGFALHLGMSGRIKIFTAGEKSERLKHDHFQLRMKNGTRVVFNDARRFGMIFPVSRFWEKESPFSAMGPEPLGKKFNAQILAENLRERRTPVKTALLDQRVVAGVGNIYACEALYEAGIHPMRIAASLNREECRKLAAAIRMILKKAIAEGGSSLRDYRNTKGDLGYFQHHFSVYDRAGKPCPGCTCNPLKTGGIKRIVQAGRSTFYCPEKQRPEKAGGKRPGT